MKYTIGFKSGSIVELDTNNEGGDWLEDVRSAMNSGLKDYDHWYCEPDLMLLTNQIEFIIPSTKLVLKSHDH
jgi:hypothetical protein